MGNKIGKIIKKTEKISSLVGIFFLVTINAWATISYTPPSPNVEQKAIFTVTPPSGYILGAINWNFGDGTIVETKEKFIIEVTDKGLDIFRGGERALHFTASEALMLLDILQNEETNLKRMADEAAPAPIRINNP